MMLRFIVPCVCLVFAPLTGLAAQSVGGPAVAPAASPVPAWVTLGTMGGPVPSQWRSQPANALVWPDEAWLIDCGDGAMGQLAKIGIPPRATTVVFLSHLHFDHTAGLAGVIGLRFQTNAPGKLAIYGPGGTKKLVNGIIRSMKPAAEAGYGLPGEARVNPADTVTVRDLSDGESLIIGNVKIRTAQNSHFSFAAKSRMDRAYKSFSYRFDLPGRSIVYTGDTGPSPAVERLGKGADLLVSELIDVEAVVAQVRKVAPNLSDEGLRTMKRHLSEHHLTPEQVGDMAGRMEVKRVVVTHFAGAAGMSGKTGAYAAIIAALAKADVEIANDLERF